MVLKNPERALATIVGEVHALFMAVQALAATHPNPDAAIQLFNTISDAGLANIEPHPIPDAAIQGYQHVVQGFHKALESNRAKNESRNL
jgi:hypothetical protein